MIKNSLKIKNLKLKIILVILAVCYTLFASSKAYASGLSLGVYPPIIQIQIDPPANIETLVTIQNLGEEIVNLDIIFKPFTAKNSENGEVFFLPNNKVYSKIFEKIQIFDGNKPLSCRMAGNDDKGCITLAPSEQKKLNLHIVIPKDEPISDYYFSVVFIRSSLLPGGSQDSRDGGTSQTTGGVATNVLLSIGKGQAKGIIEEFSSPLFLEKGPVPFTVRVKNTGKHVIAPIGQILIKNFFGQTVGKVDLLPVNILAETTRVIPDSSSTALQGDALRGINIPKAVWYEKFLLGPYTATLTLALSDEGPIYKKTINFYGAPIQVSIGLIVVILIVMLVVGKVRERLA